LSPKFRGLKILVCFGTRPEAIKMAPLVNVLKNSSLSFEVCVTAQHREMLDQVLDFFEIRPNYDLDLMLPNQSLNGLSSRILSAFDVVLERSKPSLVLVHGDTTTSAICALAAFHRGIKVGHIEAGLRTYNKMAPFPEEINRQLTGRIADFHFAPTQWAQQNLLSEKIDIKFTIVTGNTVIDALLWGINKLNQGFVNSTILDFRTKIDIKKKTILVTGHRRENFGDSFINICEALSEIATNPDVQIIYPVHLNPSVQKPVYKILGEKSNVLLVPPVDYPTFIWLMNQASLIITDSGGVQEEAPALHKPVLVMREVSERPEGIEAGLAELVGTNKELIINRANHYLNLPDNQTNTTVANPYGDGSASNKIVNYIYEMAHFIRKP
jgi:UDP-N-acetylglucosamine 2-epimerase (non-hydrolysing)